jgi:hypothetical protein
MQRPYTLGRNTLDDRYHKLIIRRMGGVSRFREIYQFRYYVIVGAARTRREA